MGYRFALMVYSLRKKSINFLYYPGEIVDAIQCLGDRIENEKKYC